MFQVAMVSLLQVFPHITPTLNVYMHAKFLHSCLTLCSSMDHSPQASLFTGFSRQEYWSRLSCPPPGDLPNSEMEPVSPASPALAGRFSTTSATSFSLYKKQNAVFAFAAHGKHPCSR